MRRPNYVLTQQGGQAAFVYAASQRDAQQQAKELNKQHPQNKIVSIGSLYHAAKHAKRRKTRLVESGQYRNPYELLHESLT